MQSGSKQTKSKRQENIIRRNLSNRQVTGRMGKGKGKGTEQRVQALIV